MIFIYFMIKYNNEQNIFLSSKHIEIHFLNVFALIEDTDAWQFNTAKYIQKCLVILKSQYDNDGRFTSHVFKFN